MTNLGPYAPHFARLAREADACRSGRDATTWWYVTRGWLQRPTVQRLGSTDQRLAAERALAHVWAELANRWPTGAR